MVIRATYPRRPRASSARRPREGGERTPRSSSSVGAPADADPQRPVGVDAHRREHRRRLERLARARRARVHGDAVLVEAEQDRLRLDAVDAEAHEVGQALVGVAEAVDAVDGGRDPPRAGPSARAPRPPRAPAGRPRRARRRRRRSRRSRATSSMPPRRARSCAPPTTNGGQRRPRRTSSAAAPFGPPSLWRGDRAEVGAERGEVDRNVTRRPRTRRRGRARRARGAASTISADRSAACPPRGWRAGR